MSCCFENGKKCTILKRKRCWGCKFKKTQEEFDTDKKQAENSLANRRLGVFKDAKNGVEIVTVRPIFIF